MADVDHALTERCARQEKTKVWINLHVRSEACCGQGPGRTDDLTISVDPGLTVCSSAKMQVADERNRQGCALNVAPPRSARVRVMTSGFRGKVSWLHRTKAHERVDRVRVHALSRLAAESRPCRAVYVASHVRRPAVCSASAWAPRSRKVRDARITLAWSASSSSDNAAM